MKLVSQWQLCALCEQKTKIFVENNCIIPDTILKKEGAFSYIRRLMCCLDLTCVQGTKKHVKRSNSEGYFKNVQFSITKDFTGIYF